MATLNNFTITSAQNQDILIYSNGSWINSNISGFFGILDGRYSANTHNHDGRYILKADAYTKSQTYPAASLYTKAEIDAMFDGFDPGSGGGGGGGGLVNSASNVGSGAGVFHANSSGDLQFRSLFSQDIDLLTITVSGTSVVLTPKVPTWSKLVSANGQLTTSHVNFANQGLNTSSQPSFAGLTVDTGSWSSSGLKLTGAAPSIYFSQDDGNNAYLGVNGTTFYVLPDNDSNGSYESPYILQIGMEGSSFKYYGNEVYHEGHKPTWSEVTGKPTLASVGYRSTSAVLNDPDTLESGFYTTSQAANLSLGSSWAHIINMHHNDNNGYNAQISLTFGTNPRLRIRGAGGGAFSSWFDVWTSNNDGSGSGLDADKLDGYHASSFMSVSGDYGSDMRLGKYIYLRDYDDGDTSSGIKSYVRDGVWRLSKDTNTPANIDINLDGNYVYHQGRKPSWNDVTGKPSTFPPSAHTHSYTEVSFNGSFDINGTGPGAQDSGIYVSSVTAQGTTLNPTYTAILSAQTSSSRSIHLTVDSDGYLHGMRSHSNAGTYTFDSKTKYSDEASLVRSIGTATVPSSRNTLRDGLFHYGTRGASNNPPHSSNYGESIVWGEGDGGSVELWGGWTSGGWGRLYTRALRDTGDNWSSWYEVYTSREPRLRSVYANGFQGLAAPDGNASNWIRTTSNGILPYQSGGASSLGTSSWRFNSTYSNNFYGSYMSLSNRLDIVNGIEVTGINKGIYFNPAGYNDQGGIRYIGTNGNDGAMEFWTNDDYGEPFAFRMYDSGSSGTYREPLRINSTQLVANSEILINHNSGLVVRTSTNGAGARITFSDNASSNYSQRGFLIYKHSNGAFGIPSGDAFELSGSENDTKFIVRGEGWADDWVATSDIRVKKNLERIDSSLEKVAKLAGYTYDQINLKQRKAGLIAQDVKEVLPEAVGEDGEGMLNVSPMAVLGLLVNAVNDLSEQIKELKENGDS